MKRKVKFRKWVPVAFDEKNQRIKGSGAYSPEFTEDGLFHQWGLNVEDYSESVASFTVGIIELKDGTNMSLIPEHFRFVSPQDYLKGFVMVLVDLSCGSHSYALPR